MMPLLTELEPFGFAGCYKDVSPDGLSISEREEIWWGERPREPILS